MRIGLTNIKCLKVKSVQFEEGATGYPYESTRGEHDGMDGDGEGAQAPRPFDEGLFFAFIGSERDLVSRA